MAKHVCQRLRMAVPEEVVGQGCIGAVIQDIFCDSGTGAVSRYQKTLESSRHTRDGSFHIQLFYVSFRSSQQRTDSHTWSPSPHGPTPFLVISPTQVCHRIDNCSAGPRADVLSDGLEGYDLAFWLNPAEDMVDLVHCGDVSASPDFQREGGSQSLDGPTIFDILQITVTCKGNVPV